MASKNNTYFVYILECNDGTFYTGITNELQRRIRTHNLGKGAKYTKGRVPVVLKYFEKIVDRGSALKREHQIKQLTREEKGYLIARCVI